MSQSLIIYLSIGAALLAVSYFKVSNNYQIKNIEEKKYWKSIGKNFDINYYKIICTVLVPSLIIEKMNFVNGNYIYAVPVLIISILLIMERRAR